MIRRLHGRSVQGISKWGDDISTMRSAFARLRGREASRRAEELMGQRPRIDTYCAAVLRPRTQSSAFVAVRQSFVGYPGRTSYSVSRVERFPVGLALPALTQQLKKLYSEVTDRDGFMALALDTTALGDGCWSVLNSNGLDGQYAAYLVEAGDAVDSGVVGFARLISEALAIIQDHRLVVGDVAGADLLDRERRGVRVVTLGEDSLPSYRCGTIFQALALALWHGEQNRYVTRPEE